MATNQHIHGHPIDITYIFAWSDVSHELPRRYDPLGSSLHIVQDEDEPSGENGEYICIAYFEWGLFEAEFACHYNPATDDFDDFEIDEESAEEDMLRNVEKISIYSHDWDYNNSVESTVRDDNGNKFIVVYMDFEYSACSWSGAMVYGKKALTEEEKSQGLELSRDERRKLEISDEDWERAIVGGYGH